MTSHQSHSTTSQDKPKLSSSPSGLDDLKKLKSRFGSQLATLKELFSDWSDEDLLFAIQDADGDLELAIDRISEGHVCQWGEVKSKKSKKEAAQKVKASVGPSPPASSHTSTQQPRVDRPPMSRGSSERTKRGGRGVRSNNKSFSEHAPSRGDASRTASSQPDTSSWASIASNPRATNDAAWGSTTAEADSNWNSSSTATPWGTTSEGDVNASAWPSESTTDHFAKKSVSSSAATTAPSTVPSTTPSATPSTGKTWASLLKSQPKPETTRPPAPDTTTSEWDAPTTQKSTTHSTSEWDAPDSWGASTNNTDTTTNKQNETSSAGDAWTSSTTDKPRSPAPGHATAVETSSQIDNAQDKQPPSAEEQDDKTLSASKPSTGSRRLVQDEPVVLPNNSASVTSVGVKFGSLNLDDTTMAVTEESTSVLQREPSPVAQQDTRQVDTLSQLKQQPKADTQEPQQQPQAAPAAPAAPSAPAQAGQAGQATPAAQATQQQHLLADHFGSGAHVYQQPSGISGFGMNPMATLPDYGFYGMDAQRAAAAAAAMGYYDPTAYNASPSPAVGGAYRDKHTQEPLSSVHAQNNQVSGVQTQQQMYPTNLQYYQYYYMQNQYPGYQQTAGYGQPYMNKNMYSGMYQQHVSGKTPTGTGTSPYGTAASPYAQNTYNLATATGSGYEDVSGLQHHMGMGLHDYQKQYTSPQHRTGFLAGAGPMSQSSTPLADGQNNKGDASQLGKAASGTAGTAGTATSSAGTQYHQNYQQQQAMNPANYFGHSLPYQQQYPQHFPPYQNTSHQGQTSLPTSTSQQSSVGRQQPYWSQ